MPACHPRAPLLRPAHAAAGFTLLEACLAFSALSFGLLALAQFQGALQASLDAARERSLAIRLAQATLERRRHFSVLEPAEAATSYAQVTSSSETVSLTADGAREASLRLEVSDHPALHHKAARVTVSWRTRHGRQQVVQLDTLIAGVAP